MSKLSDRTTTGGTRSVFHTTCWTEILDSRTSDETRQRLIINDLLSRYWKPVYCYIRRKGYDNESAKDLTQGFFHEIILGHELIQHADKTKGRFRTFLLTALDRYIIDIHRYETADKRSPTGKMLQLDDIDLSEVSMSASDVTPEKDFHYAWVSDLLDHILSEVKDECYSIGKEVYWEVFHERCLAPIMNDVSPLSITKICKKHDIDNEAKASNMIVTVKRRLRRALERYLQQLIRPDSEVEEELYELLQNLSKKGAR